MTPEMITILAVGVALAGLTFRGHQRLDKRMDGFDDRLRSLENGQSELRGRILGKLELIERYIIARNLPAGEPALQPGGASQN